MAKTLVNSTRKQDRTEYKINMNNSIFTNASHHRVVPELIYINMYLSDITNLLICTIEYYMLFYALFS